MQKSEMTTLLLLAVGGVVLYEMMKNKTATPAQQTAQQQIATYTNAAYRLGTGAYNLISSL